MRIVVPAAALLGMLCYASSALAHIDLLSPPARENEEKQGPCGREGSVRGDLVTEVRAGSTLRVTFRETIDHPSHFRISFDADGDDDFIDPATADDRFTNDTVLVDGISDEGGGTFSVDVKLPDIECDRCTLQLIQLMYDKAPYAPGTNDLYYRCADLTLRRDAALPPPTGPGAEPDAGLAETPTPSAGGGHGGYGNSGNEQATNSETAAPSSQPAGSGMCSPTPVSRDLPAAWALGLGLLLVFSFRQRKPPPAGNRLMSKRRQRC